MPLLIFVMTFLMLIAAITYARIESYRDIAAAQEHFEQFMFNKERQYYNDRAKKLYDKTHVKTKESKDDEDADKKTKATSKLSLYPLLDRKTREGQAEIADQHRFALKELIHLLYGDKDFYKQAAESRPKIIDEYIEALLSAVDKLPDDQKPTEIKDLYNLELEDDALTFFAYQMLKGGEEEGGGKAGSSEGNKESKSGLIRKKGSNGQKKNGSKNGYPSLEKFINIDKNSKLRLYLASTPLLMVATGGNVSLVNEIISKRNDLFKKVKNGEIDAETASSDFKDFFGGRFSTLFQESFLEFTVSKTDPKGYD